MRCAAVLLFSSILWSASYCLGDSTSILITIEKGYDGVGVWTGVFVEKGEASDTIWTHSIESQFSIEVPDTHVKGKVVLLKKNFLPIIRPITTTLMRDGLKIEFAKGARVLGTVSAKKDTLPIEKGSLSISLDGSKYKFSPPNTNVLEWDLEEDGTFTIGGVPPGEHTVRVVAPSYMPAEEPIVVSTADQQLEINFQLPKAEYITGHMEVYAERLRVIGEIEIVVTPPESQTVNFTTEFDEEKNFRIGPFAEEAELEIVARLPNERRSSLKRVTVPLEQSVTLWLFDWVRVFGTVVDRETGEPVHHFFLVRDHLKRIFEINDPMGQFSEEIKNTHASLSIDAPGYVYWKSAPQVSFQNREEYDFGTIELDRAFTVKGRVLTRSTGDPIEGARIVRYLNNDSDTSDFSAMRWNYSSDTITDSNGDFELSGFSNHGGRVMASAQGYSTDILTIEDVDVPLKFELNPLGSISGQVVTLMGKPVTAQIYYSGGGFRADDGNFHFEVEEGLHRYRAVAENGRSKVVETLVEIGQKVEGIRIVIDIVGRVYGSIEGLNEGESVRVWADGTGVGSDRLQTDGQYEFFGLEPGDYEIVSQTSLNRELKVPVTLNETNEVRVDFQFIGGGSLSGRVLAGQEFLGETTVHAQPLDSSLPTSHTETENDGSFEFEILANGRYQLAIPSRAFVEEIEVDGATRVELSVGDHSIKGQLRANGSVLNAEVRVKSGPEGRQLQRGLSDIVDASGEFRFDGLPSGTYTIEVSHPDYVDHSQQIEVKFDVGDLDIYLEQAVFED